MALEFLKTSADLVFFILFLEYFLILLNLAYLSLDAGIQDFVVSEQINQIFWLRNIFTDRIRQCVFGRVSTSHLNKIRTQPVCQEPLDKIFHGPIRKQSVKLRN